MADRAMLEASMLLHRDSANYLLGLAAAGPLDVAVSKLVLEIADSDPGTLARRLAPQLAIPADMVVHVTVLQQLARALRGEGNTYHSSPPEPDRFQALMESTHDDLVAQIIFEEWYFLTSESWLFSKTRQAFDRMIDAGGAALQLSGRVFDEVVRRTLKKGPGEPLTPGNRVRAAAKWIAVGGPAIVSIFEPLSGAVAGAAGKFFMLMDP